MTNLSRALIGTAGLAAAMAIASPASAQQAYPYGNQNTGVLGAIVNAVTGGGYGQYPQSAYGYGQYPQSAYGYGQYPQGSYGYGQMNQQAAIGMCAAAAEQRISGNYGGRPSYGYNNGYANYGYQQGYAYGQGGRVLGITNVERRNNGSLRISGVASSGRGYGYPSQGYYNGYNGQNAYANQGGDLRFTCKVNTRGQLTDVNFNRSQVAYRGF